MPVALRVRRRFIADWLRVAIVRRVLLLAAVEYDCSLRFVPRRPPPAESLHTSRSYTTTADDCAVTSSSSSSSSIMSMIENCRSFSSVLLLIYAFSENFICYFCFFFESKNRNTRCRMCSLHFWHATAKEISSTIGAHVQQHYAVADYATQTVEEITSFVDRQRLLTASKRFRRILYSPLVGTFKASFYCIVLVIAVITIESNTLE